MTQRNFVTLPKAAGCDEIAAGELTCASFDGGITYQLAQATTAGWYLFGPSGLEGPYEAIHDPTGCRCVCPSCPPAANRACALYGSSFLGQWTFGTAGVKFPGEPNFDPAVYDSNATSYGCPPGPIRNLFFQVLAWEINGIDYAPPPGTWVQCNTIAALEAFLNSITPTSVFFSLSAVAPFITVYHPDNVPVRIVITDGYDDQSGNACGPAMGWVIEHDGMPANPIVDDVVASGVTASDSLATADGLVGGPATCIPYP